jgi:hypothetical protein
MPRRGQKMGIEEKAMRWAKGRGKEGRKEMKNEDNVVETWHGVGDNASRLGYLDEERRWR